MASESAAALAASPIRHALLSILCFGDRTYNVGYVGWGSPGLFSMLNNVADQLLTHVYRGQTVRDVGRFYESTRLIGYGNASLSAFFRPWTCAPLQSGGYSPSAVATLVAASRYQVASHLLHLMYSPRSRPLRASGRSGYALAIHVRRGDKLVEGRKSESIAIWSEAQVVQEARNLLLLARRPSKGSGMGGGGAASGRTGAVGESGADVRSRSPSAPSATPTILLASDDNAFARRVAERLMASLGVRVEHIDNEHDAGTAAPFDACDASCVPPLQELADAFARASTLLLSTKSNMGSFLLSWWGAPNGDLVPQVVDMDGKTKVTQLQRGRYFCALQWGARHGMCESNHTEHRAVEQRPDG